MAKQSAEWLLWRRWRRWLKKDVSSGGETRGEGADKTPRRRRRRRRITDGGSDAAH